MSSCSPTCPDHALRYFRGPRLGHWGKTDAPPQCQVCRLGEQGSVLPDTNLSKAFRMFAIKASVLRQPSPASTLSQEGSTFRASPRSPVLDTWGRASWFHGLGVPSHAPGLRPPLAPGSSLLLFIESLFSPLGPNTTRLIQECARQTLVPHLLTPHALGCVPRERG